MLLCERTKLRLLSASASGTSRNSAATQFGRDRVKADMAGRAVGSAGVVNDPLPTFRPLSLAVCRLIARALVGWFSVARRSRQRRDDGRRRALPAGRHHLAFVHQRETAAFHSRWQRQAFAIVRTEYFARWLQSR